MPSFLAKVQTKVFGRNRDDKESPRTSKRTSQPSLLEGKFEAISPPSSPSIPNFQPPKEKEKAKEKEKDGVLPSLFRSRSRPVSPPLGSQKQVVEAPHLSLNLPGLKEESSRTLGAVFEADSEGRSLLSDAVIGERRLSPVEALTLIQACSQAIIARGLETLGIMHPHWYSASPDVQRKLISLFILSISPPTPTDTPSTPISPVVAKSAFESETADARSPHDVAAVLRWGLRHLRIEGDSFGKTSPNWLWYTTFLEAERKSAYPPKAFTNELIPLLPPAHAQLLSTLLDIISSLASHAETNGISGSKLTKFIGLWLLTASRTEHADDWNTFYARWERAGRILEHLFLARIRDEAASHSMPKRLTELVTHYPYSKGQTGEEFLPRPRFTTRKYDALFVRIENELAFEARPKSKKDPLRIIADAFKSESGAEQGEYDPLWDAIKKAATPIQEGEQETGDNFALPKVFADETTRLFSLLPRDLMDKDAPLSPTFSSFSSPPVVLISAPQPKRRRSSSMGDPSERRSSNGHVNGSGTVTSSPTSPTSPSSPTDWLQFSTSGFGELGTGNSLAATLFDTDVEKTAPPSAFPSRKSSRKRRPSPGHSRRSSIDYAASTPPAMSPIPISIPKPAKVASITLIQLDEAFVDFWSDALLDPISSTWPSFVVCQLRNLSGLQTPDNKPVNWLVIEHAYTVPPPPPVVETPVSPVRATSPRPSIDNRKSSTFKRFHLFGSQDSKTSSKKKDKLAVSPRVGEMGEILAEEEEKPVSVNAPAPSSQESGKAAAVRTSTAVVATAAAATALVVESEEPSPAPVPPSVPEVAPLLTSEPEVTPVAQVVEAEVVQPVQPDATVASEPVQESVSPVVQEVAPPESTLKVLLPEPVEEPVPTVPVQEVAPTQETPAPIQESTPTETAKVEIPVHTHLPVPTDKHGESLPPAPESVVLAGETPGPQVALSTSEPVAVAHLLEQAEVEHIEVAQEPEQVSAVESAAYADDSVPAPVPVESIVASEVLVEPTGVLLAEASTPVAESEEEPAPTTEAPGIPAAPPVPDNEEESETISAREIFPAQSDLNVPQPTDTASSVPEPQLEEALVERVVPHVEPEVTFVDSVVPPAEELTIPAEPVDHGASVDDSLIESTQPTPITKSSPPASVTEEQSASEVVQEAPDHVTTPESSPAVAEVPDLVDQPHTEADVVPEPKISSMQPEIDQPTAELAPVVEPQAADPSTEVDEPVAEAVAPGSPVVHAEVEPEIVEQPESFPAPTTEEHVQDAPAAEDPEVEELTSVVVPEDPEHDAAKVEDSPAEEPTAVVNVADEPAIEVVESSIPLTEGSHISKKDLSTQKADIPEQNGASLPAESEEKLESNDPPALSTEDPIAPLTETHPPDETHEP
ncbi:hypothetical protein JAAARDRAFT_61984 [Jaapia argillacea MUCL 33604]|uniref:Meiotically up-regulated protein Msb1/Mug8 domain-containing protein n=1 Tax=Jaapia argillacea MUCL 33604 TaxID=933084 RepID=A0A067PF69_9AGAM|nr:hypothetical protein JAAARDRAFT_61984 [Jaapia argillacea MUCL 33604]